MGMVSCIRPPVYPRVCGGTTITAAVTRGDAGLSPRVRGNPVAVNVGALRIRSIPACAGEPPFAAVPGNARRVYPRVCGGTT